MLTLCETITFWGQIEPYFVQWRLESVLPPFGLDGARLGNPLWSHSTSMSGLPI